MVMYITDRICWKKKNLVSLYFVENIDTYELLTE